MVANYSNMLDMIHVGDEVVKNSNEEIYYVKEVIEKSITESNVLLDDGNTYSTNQMYRCGADGKLHLSAYVE